MLVSLGVLIHDWGGFATREHCLRRNSNTVREEYNAELFFASTNGQIKSLLDMKSEVSEEDPCRSALFCPGVKHPNARHLLSSHTSGRGITRGQLCSQLNLLPLHPLVFLGQTTAKGGALSVSWKSYHGESSDSSSSAVLGWRDGNDFSSQQPRLATHGNTGENRYQKNNTRCKCSKKIFKNETLRMSSPSNTFVDAHFPVVDS